MPLFCSDKVLLFHTFFQCKGVVTQINSSAIYNTAILCILEGIKLYLKHLQISLLKIKICAKVSFAIDLIAIFSLIT